MDAFEAKYWSRLQTLVWVLTRSKEAVRWASYEPWRRGSLEPDGYGGPRGDGKPGPIADNEDELIGLAIINLGSVMDLFDAEKELIKALADGALRAYPAPDGSEFFERATVLNLWREQVAARRSSGRPPEPYKQTVIEKALALLDYEGGDLRQANIVRFMGDFCSELGEDPGESTLKRWAREAAAEHKRRCEAGERKGVKIQF